MVRSEAFLRRVAAHMVVEREPCGVARLRAGPAARASSTPRSRRRAELSAGALVLELWPAAPAGPRQERSAGAHGPPAPAVSLHPAMSRPISTCRWTTAPAWVPSVSAPRSPPLPAARSTTSSSPTAPSRPSFCPARPRSRTAPRWPSQHRVTRACSEPSRRPEGWCRRCGCGTPVRPPSISARCWNWTCRAMAQCSSTRLTTPPVSRRWPRTWWTWPTGAPPPARRSSSTRCPWGLSIPARTRCCGRRRAPRRSCRSVT